VNNNIKKRLEEIKMSQSKASRLADVPQGSFNLIANNKLYPCPAWRKRIAEVLGMREEELFNIN
jgi:DNA-binding XRE family transcriptional regulator